jgi:hypothetical protein
MDTGSDTIGCIHTESSGFADIDNDIYAHCNREWMLSFR